MDQIAMSVASFAEALGISDDLAYRMLDEGLVPEIRMGKRRLVPTEAVLRIKEAAMAGFDPAAAVAHIQKAAAS